MSRKAINLTPLQARKQLLVVESELNRNLLVAEWHDVRAGVEQIGSQLSTMTSLAESVIKIGNSFAHFFKEFSSSSDDDDGKKSSWFSSLSKIARTGMSFLFQD